MNLATTKRDSIVLLQPGFLTNIKGFLPTSLISETSKTDEMVSQHTVTLASSCYVGKLNGFISSFIKLLTASLDNW